MRLKGVLFSHLTCLMYIPFLGNFRNIKIRQLQVKKDIIGNKQLNYTLFVHDSSCEAHLTSSIGICATCGEILIFSVLVSQSNIST